MERFSLTNTFNKDIFTASLNRNYVLSLAPGGAA